MPIKVELTGDEARLLAALDKVINKERELAQAVGDVSKPAGGSGGTENVLKDLRGMDRQLGGIVHLGRSLGGILGVSGGIAGGVAGGVALIRREVEKIHASLRATGQLQIKLGEEAGTVAGFHGAAGVRNVRQLSAELGLPQEEIRASYLRFAREGAGPEGALSQTRRERQAAHGGPAFRKLRGEGAVVAPQIIEADAAERSRLRQEAALAAPTTLAAARQTIRGRSEAREKQIMDELAAEKYGVQGWENVPYSATTRPGAGAEHGRFIRERRAGARQEWDLPPERPEDQWGKKGTIILSSAEVDVLAQKLLESAEAQRSAAEAQRSAAGDLSRAGRPDRW